MNLMGIVEKITRREGIPLTREFIYHNMGIENEFSNRVKKSVIEERDRLIEVISNHSLNLTQHGTSDPLKDGNLESERFYIKSLGGDVLYEIVIDKNGGERNAISYNRRGITEIKNLEIAIDQAIAYHILKH